jgi:type IV secretory pathway ATPase VirB11/archaellum biosynthesis ATPase
VTDLDSSPHGAPGSRALQLPGDQVLRALQDELVGDINGAIDRLAFVHADDSVREHLGVLRATLRAQVVAYFEHLVARRAVLSPHTSVMYAEAVGAPGVVATTVRGLLEAGTLSIEQGKRLMQLVGDRRTVLVVGARRAGKSTLLNALFEFVSVDERLVAIENGAELPALRDRSFCVRLGADDGTDLPALYARARRMNANRLVIGELRAADVREFFALLADLPRSAGMATFRAGTVEEALRSLPVWFGGAPPQALEVLARARPVLVHMRRDGVDLPRVTAIWSVEGIAGDELMLKEVETSTPFGQGLLAEV